MSFEEYKKTTSNMWIETLKAELKSLKEMDECWSEIRNKVHWVLELLAEKEKTE